MAFIFGKTSADNLLGTSGNDTIVGWASGGNANSTSGNDTLNGVDGNDSLAGGTANDSLSGGNGNDTLDGGTGNDTLIGGAGNDTFISSQDNDSINGGDGIDTADYSQLNQTITLSGFGTIEKAGKFGQDQLFRVEKVIANPNVANNTIDASQSLAEVSITVNLQTQSLAASNVPGLGRLSFTAVNFDNVIGTNGNDSIVGDRQNNRLSGNNGNDTLDGGLGTDTLSGGAGDDTYIIDSTTDTITEAANSGTDTVRSSVTYILGTNLENLRLREGSDITGTGNSLSNFIFGNTSNNTLNGGAGDDTLDGNNGNDILNGGDGNDSLQGGPGNEVLNGGAGDDILIGVFPGSPLPPGIGETDRFTGGDGADRFILGDALNVFYDDNNTTSPGFGDLATITDFDSSQDRIELKGTPQDYRLQTITGNTRIFLDKPTGEQDEIIGVLEGKTNLKLDSDDFLFYERENPGEDTNNSLDSAEGLGFLSSGSDINISAQLATVQPGDNSDFDFFKFSVANSGTVTISTATSGDTILGLFDSAGTVLETNDDNGLDQSSLINTFLNAGTYSISVSKFSFLPEDGGIFSGSTSVPDFSYTLGVSFA
ncbi:outer membrane secretion protein [Nostoc commune NIES-4072]|uniref:Outer membrane secretion protein n=1 Tax=Nostoc commune NIES-4072 TaxID=2005467 RepID=A0A2R5FMG8_NOSCO|nr:pre-peptidase C-terminal domain-containing protein [Nostoc commune]BBD65851.1 outer membrane secretion protein [Nostoc commune HK-02]GBG16824.1 outer membrane secretion protein [Nostoc commune NIES-4072]